jgi:Pseudouridylate synthases, 23S RNA-specific
MKLSTEAPITLFDLVMQKLNLGSKSKAKKIVEYATIHINDKPNNNPRQIVNPGDIVTLEREKQPAMRVAPPYPILYEDNDLLVALKPAGLLTHGVGEENRKSFVGILGNYFNTISKGRERIYVVHRLDREVAGLLIFAKSIPIQEKLKDNWKSVDKLYYALVESSPKASEGVIESWLHEHPKSLKVYSGRKSPEAKLAITNYKLVKEVAPYYLLQIKLDTGRKNQIRVHLSDIGCPIVGDYRYGASSKTKRQIRLFAYFLQFPHPATGKIIKVEAVLPKSFLHPEEKDENYK